jgi:hypothetical protein
VGHVGLVFNFNYAQIADFFLGIVGFDLANDDGRKYGLWPWETKGWPLPSAGDETAKAK